MTDIALHWNDDVYAGDIAVFGADLELDEGLRSAILLSLFSDARAQPGDVAEDEDPRGYWGDALTEGDRFGSRLWLLERSKQPPTSRYARKGTRARRSPG